MFCINKKYLGYVFIMLKILNLNILKYAIILKLIQISLMHRRIEIRIIKCSTQCEML